MLTNDSQGCGQSRVYHHQVLLVPYVSLRVCNLSLMEDSVGSAMSGWDDTVMFDAYKDHLTNEPDLWHAYLAKRDDVIIGTAVVVPPGKTPSSA